MKAIILARVSSREQEEGYSLDAQMEKLKEYCERKELRVMAEYRIIESSTKGTRKQFHQMLDQARNHKEPVAIVADAVDRVLRSFSDLPAIDKLIQQKGLELHFLRDNSVISRDSNASARMFWNFQIMMAQAYIDQMKDNVKRSYKFKLKNGEICWMAPIGYVNVKHPETGRGTVAPDTESAPIIRRIFEHYATGAYGVRELAVMAKKWGLISRRTGKCTVTKTSIQRILQNKFYFGYFEHGGELIKHPYEPLITKGLYDMCAKIRSGACTSKPQQTKKPYIFRGLITCGVTGRTVMSDTAKGKYTYLISYSPENPNKKVWTNETKVLKQVEDVFRRISFPREVLDQAIAQFNILHEQEAEMNRDMLKRLKREDTETQAKMDRLMDAFLSGVVDEDMYKVKSSELKIVRHEIKESIERCHNADSAFKDSLVRFVSLVSRAHSIFMSSGIEQKRQFISLLFSNLTLTGGDLQYSLRPAFKKFVNVGQCPEWREIWATFRTDDELYNAVIHNASIFANNARMPCKDSQLS